ANVSQRIGGIANCKVMRERDADFYAKLEAAGFMLGGADTKAEAKRSKAKAKAGAGARSDCAHRRRRPARPGRPVRQEELVVRRRG
ncbi:MAG: hypothetical protein AAF721_34945, partial [Myxococcota bacterium]